MEKPQHVRPASVSVEPWAFVEPHAVLVELVRSSERVDSRVATS